VNTTVTNSRTQRQRQTPPSFSGHPDGKRRRASILIPLLITTLVASGIAYTSRGVVQAVESFSQCRADNAAAVVPDDDGVLLGVNLDWNSETLGEHSSNLGHDPSVVVQFSDIPYDDETWEHTTNAVSQARATGAVLLLTLEPHGGLATLSDDVIAKLAADLRAVNDQGTPVVLRFAHEMNGSWYAWGQQPAQYVEAFRKVSAAVHASAPGTSLMWAPNYGGGYPFTGGQFAARPGTADFAILDTDKDGILTMADDTYAPYYPGDDAVDWVGISLYHWGNQRPWGNNEVTENGKFLAMLTGTYTGTAGNDEPVPDFYQVYGVEHHRPVAIPETAAIYTPSRAGESELAVKQAWWRQVFSEETHQRFPQLKMINWFEWNKYEIEINDQVDWRSAGSPAIREAFLADLPSWLRYGENLRTCR
jgi:hypothetical protein